MDIELAQWSAADTARAIRQRVVSPVEVVDAAIERIEARNPSLNAFVFNGFDDARRAARKGEQAVVDGRELGPLHGVPTAIKDLFDFKPGWPTTFGGIRALTDFVADLHCPFAERMERAGAIIVGKTNSPVMGFRGTCDNPLFGPTRNPFDLSRNSGGSSGGSAAAVADGLVPIAEGTDGGGSIRIPASACGTYGYKASFGRVPAVNRPNAFSLTDPFTFEGPITRTVEDAALVVQAVAGYDARDPYALEADIDAVAALDRPLDGWRIAYSPDFDVYPVDARVADVVRRAVTAFEELGATVDEVRLGLQRDQRELSDLWCRLIMPLNIQTLEVLKHGGRDLLADHADDLPAQYRRWVEHGYRLSVTDILADQSMRTEVYDAIQGVFEDHVLLVTPTLAALPPTNGMDGNTVGPSQINGIEVDSLIGWCMTYFLNFSGHPAASIPAGLADGLPVGMQLIGRRYADVDVIAASAAFERVRPWAETYRICADRPVDRVDEQVRVQRSTSPSGSTSPLTSLQ